MELTKYGSNSMLKTLWKKNLSQQFIEDISNRAN